MKIKKSFGNFDLDIELNCDSPLGLIGPNGAGKSLLLKTILGAIYIDEGNVQVNGQTWFSSANNINVAIENRRCSYMPQRFSLFRHLSVVENVAFGVSKDLSKKERVFKAETMLERFKAKQLLNRNTNTLSGGEVQKVNLARAFVSEPQLVLLDEPFSALDVTQREEAIQLVREVVTELKVLTIITSHSLKDFVKFNWPIFVIEKGRLTHSGSIQEIKRAAKSTFVEDFFRPIL